MSGRFVHPHPHPHPTPHLILTLQKLKSVALAIGATPDDPYSKRISEDAGFYAFIKRRITISLENNPNGGEEKEEKDPTVIKTANSKAV